MFHSVLQSVACASRLLQPLVATCCKPLEVAVRQGEHRTCLTQVATSVCGCCLMQHSVSCSKQMYASCCACCMQLTTCSLSGSLWLTQQIQSGCLNWGIIHTHTHTQNEICLLEGEEFLLLCVGVKLKLELKLQLKFK